jgi:hypothetical protein
MSVNRFELEQAGFPEMIPGREFAASWIGGLRETVRYLDELANGNPEINRAKVIRGTVVGIISGDGVNPLAEGMVFAQLKKWTRLEQLLARNGIEGTWLISTGSIQEFGNRLPVPTVEYFNEIFHRHQSFWDEIESGNLENKQRIYTVSKGLFQELQNSVRAPGMEPDDMEYRKSIIDQPLGF